MSQNKWMVYRLFCVPAPPKCSDRVRSNTFPNNCLRKPRKTVQMMEAGRREQRKTSATIFSPEEAKINTSSLKHDGSWTMGFAFIREMEGVYATYTHGEEWIMYSVRRGLMLGSVRVIISQRDAANLSHGARGDAACLSMSAMEEQSQGFTACLSQKALV